MDIHGSFPIIRPMQVRIVVVGRCRSGYIKEGFEDYARRIRRYTNLEEIEVRQERAGKGRRVEEVLEREAERIRSRLSGDEYVVALDVAGSETDSESFGWKIEKLMLEGSSRLAFLVGGAYGLAGSILRNADLRLSLSQLTLPHELARLVLMEQLYRAFTIVRGEPYHKQ